MTSDQLANLRTLALGADPGPWVSGPKSDPDIVMMADGEHVVADCSYGSVPTARYIAAVSPDVVLGLIDALREMESWGVDWRSRCDVAAGAIERLAARVLELEAPGECQSLHKLRAEVRLQSDEIDAAWDAIGADVTGDLPTAIRAIRDASGAYVRRVEAERDDLAAEVAALREIRDEQRNLPIDGWCNKPRGSACYDRMLSPDRRLMTAGTLWQLFEGPEDEDGDGTEGLVCHGFSGEPDAPCRGAMRAAEAAARSRGWL